MEKEGNQQIRKFYKKINEIDNNLMQLLTERFSIYSKIGEIKSNQEIKVFDSDHEQQIIDKFSEETMSSLFMFFMIEVVLIGEMNNLNPFNQPAVEKVKVTTRKMLN